MALKCPFDPIDILLSRFFRITCNSLTFTAVIIPEREGSQHVVVEDFIGSYEKNLRLKGTGLKRSSNPH